jgi:hypothetical protein
LVQKWTILDNSGGHDERPQSKVGLGLSLAWGRRWDIDDKRTVTPIVLLPDWDMVGVGDWGDDSEPIYLTTSLWWQSVDDR